MELQESLALIKSKFDKTQLADFDAIKELDEIKLASMGSDDTEGYQIFTPAFIVKDMVKSIGEDVVFDYSKTILEPTSGDGAFTVYILRKRLEKYFKDDKENILINGLKSLSTIYSVEMDKDLIFKQRNNIFTTYVEFLNNNNIEFDENYLEVVKCIIAMNFIWGMFNSDRDLDMALFGTEVVYKMPEAEKGKFIVLDFPVWDFSDDNIDFHMEGAEIC